ncbi:MAG: AbrB/MazE/SpoVT family DNA-binding domain-containing protein [Oscillibacter sp.]|uniref:AbrB/MazE/SpoVT family DNA-binding domain-containing protein n=2 Tax=Oscillibacter TaxID=459786 RepID=UPI00289A8B0C|nr:AbrB/MazE/SpoVT family DNA-binding domain-containing protein [Oscillibacter sp.]MEA4993913.1 AbrB/MazE/SpoVT family DNA-binding domain-containing protein [Oscillibacter sp.]
MSMRRRISPEGRINIGNDARGEPLAGKVSISGSVHGILISPYQLGDEARPDCKVTVWESGQRLVLPLQFRQKAGLIAGDTVDVLFREDGGILLVKATNICALCGEQTEDMLEMPNGRLVCPRCRRILCADEP